MQEKGKEMGNFACHNIGERERQMERRKDGGREGKEDIFKEKLCWKSPPLALSLHLVVTLRGGNKYKINLSLGR